MGKEDGKYRILECATAFAAFPYIRDWIGQYLMWKLSEGRFPKPNIPIYNWEELGKIDSSLLRTMRYITFGRYTPSFDGEYFLNRVKFDEQGTQHKIWQLDEEYPILNTEDRDFEEWPSEKWDFTSKCKGFWSSKPAKEERASNEEHIFEEPSDERPVSMSEEEIINFIKNTLGKKRGKKILDQMDAFNIAYELDNNPDALLELKGIKEKTLQKLLNAWQEFKKEQFETSV